MIEIWVWDWGLRFCDWNFGLENFWIRVGDWDQRLRLWIMYRDLGLVLVIRIRDWDWVWRLVIGDRDWGLILGIGD